MFARIWFMGGLTVTMCGSAVHQREPSTIIHQSGDATAQRKLADPLNETLTGINLIGTLNTDQHGYGNAIPFNEEGTVTDFLVGLDVSLFRALNDFVGWNPTLDRVLVHIEMLTGPLFLVIVGVLWYWPDKVMTRRRETLLMMIVAVGLSIVVNRTMSTLLPFRDRPMYGIGANAPTIADWRPAFEQWSSFPSDTATYLFAIASGLWIISRWWGLFFGVFAAFVSLARVFLGIHYPSDVFVGALIGIATCIAVSREPVRKRIAAPMLALEARYPAYFYGLFFPALGELSNGFSITRRIGVAIVHFFTGYHSA